MRGPRATLQARRHRQLLAEAIDRAYYVSQLEGSVPEGFDPAAHYLAEGARLQIDPVKDFDSRYYLDAYPDVADSGLPPFLHYLLQGRAEGRSGRNSHENIEDLRGWFDADWYGAQNPDVAGVADLDPFAHFAHTGWREGRDPAPWFSIYSWRQANPDAPEAINPFALHLRERLKRRYRLKPGWPAFDLKTWGDLVQRIEASGLVDERYYFSTYPELAGRGVSAIEHYLVAGADELRNPGPRFDTCWWASQHRVAPSEALADFLDRPDAGPCRQPGAAVVDPASPIPDVNSAVHLHLWLPEAVEGWGRVLAGRLQGLPIWVTTFTEADAAYVRRRLRQLLPGATIDVRVAADRPLSLRPVAFAERLGDISALLCLRSESTPRQSQLEGLMASLDAGGRIAEHFAGHAQVGYLCPEADLALRHEDSANWGGRLELNGWFSAAALAGWDRPAFDNDALGLDPDPAAVEAAMRADLVAGLAALDLIWAPFASAERRAAAQPGSRAQRASRFDPVGQRWPREDPAVLVHKPKPLAPRSKVFDPSRLDIAWIMPDLIAGSGGHMTILRLVEHFARFGHRQTIWIHNPRGAAPDPLAVKRAIQTGFRPLPEDVDVLFLPDDPRAISADAVIATEAWSAFPAVSVTNAKARFYLIQDYEPLFHPAGEAAILAEQTYDLGLDALTAGDWLLGKAVAHGMWARKWDLAVDRDVYFSAPERRAPAGTPRIAVYARRSTPRRAVSLAFAALNELHRRGIAFEAALFGDEYPPSGLAFPHVHMGVVPQETLGELYRSCDLGLVFSATNYSLVPLEMMACDLPVVELDGESTRAIFKAGEVTLAAPTPDAVADSLQRLLANPDLRAEQVARGRAFVAPLSWETTARSVESAILERLPHLGAEPINTAAVCAPAIRNVRRVSVVIPTYNGGRLFDRVLAAAATQDCSFEYDVLVIDSGSTDRTAEVAGKVGGRVWVHSIDKGDFQHGRTRNLGVELTDGDIVAFLTQDALPGDRQWLSRLVEGFHASERTGLVFGRHRAYPAHGLFAARDLDQMFDRFRDLGPLFSNRVGLPSFIPSGSREWRRLMGFSSDNNAAVLRAAWRRLPYPEIDWGEDQVLGWEMVRQGFDKAYADQAVVFHSHQRPAAEQLQIGVEEGRLYRREFGVELVQPEDAEATLDAMTAADIAYARASGQVISEGMMVMRRESLRLAIEGRLKGAAEAAWR